MRASFFLAAQLAVAVVGHELHPSNQRPLIGPATRHDGDTQHVKEWPSEKARFIDSLIANMTIEDLVLQLHLMFGDNLVGPRNDGKQYDLSMRLAPDSPVGNIHDLYSLNKSHHNELQRRNLDKARLSIPFLHFGECLHGVGSYQQQSLFPQPLGLAASFDLDLVRRVGRAIGSEAPSIGIHACFAPVLDLGRDPRWGRTQEGWGEDKVLTTQMGVAFSRGLSKDGTFSDSDPVVPVMKHFAAHGSPALGRNTAPYTGGGTRELQQELLMPFQAAVELGGVRGVMMAYNEIDSIPSAVHPLLYAKLREWEFDGLVIADDTAVRELETVHRVASSPADAIGQWFNAGGMIQFYDYSLEVFLNSTRELVADGTVLLSTLQKHVRTILGIKWDLGLFQQPLIPEEIDPLKLVEDHRSLVLEAAQKSIVLLKNDGALPLQRPDEVAPPKIALLGPFADTLNFGDYSGNWGQTPASDALTLREALSKYVGRQEDEVKATHKGRLVSSWGADSWEYASQNVIPPYLLSTPDGTPGGLHATYYPQVDFAGDPLVLPKPQVPALDWGIYPPPGLPSNNFSVLWVGTLTSPVDVVTNGWIGMAIEPYSQATLYIDGQKVVMSGSGSSSSASSTILGNILPWSFVNNQTASDGPPGAVPFTFYPHTTYDIRIEYQAWGALHQLKENIASLRSQMLLFWNLVDRTDIKHGQPKSIRDALDLAHQSEIVILAVGSAWNSDGENADRSSLGLPPSQEILVDTILSRSEKPVVLVLFGGRPLAIPQHYSRAAAVVSAFFPGQAGGQAIADVLWGTVDPGGTRLPRTVPRDVGQLPVHYDYKPSSRSAQYVDATREDMQPCFPFGHGLSYTTFEVANFASSTSTFTSGDILEFTADIHNTGTRSGSFTLQIYLLGRVSTVTQPVRQLVAFKRVDNLQPEEMQTITLAVDVNRYLRILDRHDQWVLEKDDYEFAARAHGGDDAQVYGTVKMTCIRQDDRKRIPEILQTLIPSLVAFVDS